MKLLPIPGLPGYRIDIENQVAYNVKGGYIKPIKARTKYKCINVNVDGFTMGQTVYRLMYCAQNNVDITKLPKDTCIAMRNGVAMVTSREEMNHERFTSKKTQKTNFEKWKRNTDLLTKYYQGDTGPLLEELKSIEKYVAWFFHDTYGLCKERAEIVAAYGVNRYLDKVSDGFPSPYIVGSVIRFARGENNRIRKAKTYIDNMKPIEL